MSTDNASKSKRPDVSIKHVVDALGRKRCLAAAFAFFAYSCQIFSMTFALPHYLTSTYAISIGAARLLSGFILAVSVAGHIASGYLLRAGLGIWICVAAALLTFSALSTSIYSGALSVPAVVVFAAIALGVGGLAPGALYASVPIIARAAENIPTTIGFLQ